MALVIEDGSIVPGADSYISRADVIAYAIKRGVVLPDTDATDNQIIKAMDYLTLFDDKWKGSQVDPQNQSLAWPRKGVYVSGEHSALPSDTIPRQIVNAQAELVMQVNTGVTLTPTVTAETAFVTREKVDVIETEYSEAIALRLMGTLPDMPLVSALLAPFLGIGGGLRTLRI